MPAQLRARGLPKVIVGDRSLCEPKTGKSKKIPYQGLLAKTWDLRCDFQLLEHAPPTGRQIIDPLDPNSGKFVPEIKQRLPRKDTPHLPSSRCDWGFPEEVPFMMSRYLDSGGKTGAKHLCLSCIKPDVEDHKCTRGCEYGVYCSAACRDSDLDLHVKVCGKLDRALDRGPPPFTSKTFLAWLFPTDELEPRCIYVWVHLDQDTGIITVKFDDASILEWYKKNESDPIRTWVAPCSAQVCSHGTLTMGHGNLLLGLSKSGLSGGPKDINQCVEALGPAGLVQPLFGPLLILSYELEDHKKPRVAHFMDADMRALSHGVDCIMQNKEYPVCAEPVHRRSMLRMASPGVKVNRVTDPWNAHRGVKYREEAITTLNIDVHGAIGHSLRHWPVAKAFEMGLRWHLVAIPAPQEAAVWSLLGWSARDADFPSLFSDVVQFSNGRYCDHKTSCWASFVVVHAYGEKITVACVESAIEYVEETEACGGQITADGFEAYFQNWKRGIDGGATEGERVESGHDAEEAVQGGSYMCFDETEHLLAMMVKWSDQAAGESDTSVAADTPKGTTSTSLSTRAAKQEGVALSDMSSATWGAESEGKDQAGAKVAGSGVGTGAEDEDEATTGAVAETKTSAVSETISSFDWVSTDMSLFG